MAFEGGKAANWEYKAPLSNRIGDEVKEGIGGRD